MLGNDGAESSSSSWTSDYVEHLRTIHFSLVTVSLGLIVCAFSYSPPEKIRIAASQVNTMIFLQDKRAVDSLAALMGIASPKIPLLPAVQQDVSTLRLPEGTAITLKNPMSSVFPLDDMSDTYPEAQFDTLAEFEKMWNKSEKDRLAVVIGKPTVWSMLDLGTQQWIVLDPTQPSFGASVLQPKWTATPDGEGFALSANEFINGHNVQLKVHCSGERRFLNLQSRLGSIFNLPNPKGSFEKVFQELSELVSKQERTEKLKAIYDSLRVQETAKADTLDAFGLHIPPRVATRFGIFVILAIQWYFFLHLVELEKTFESGASGWCVAWIGIYEKGAAKATFILSVSLFPIVSMFVLIARGTPAGNIWLLFFVAMSLTVGILTIRSIPKKASAKKAPMFE
jgi:hypothetical protein